MIGIIVTLLAVLAVICCAFHYSDHPTPQGRKHEILFYMSPKYLRQKADTLNRRSAEDASHALKHHS